MNNLTALNNVKHGKVKIKSSTDYSRYKDQHLIPVVAQDFARLPSEFPIIFVKNAETGQFMPAAMMGLKQGVNLYCQNKEWHCSVAPLSFTNAPFSLIQDDEKNSKVIVGINEASDLVNEQEGNALFNEQGEQTDYLKYRYETLTKVVESNHQMQAITAQLEKMKLLFPTQLKVNLDSEEGPYQINGVYVIDERALNELPAEDFDMLRKKGLLPLIYAQLFSMQQISRLVNKQNAFDKKA